MRPMAIACPQAQEFAKAVAAKTGVPFADTKFTTFLNGEVKSKIMESVRGADLYVFQDATNVEATSVNDNLMTLITTLDAANRSGVGRITAILPAFPYARQHKRNGREGLTAAWVLRTMEDLGVDRVVTLDLHNREIINATKKMTVEIVYATYQLIAAVLDLGIPLSELVVVAPDAGSTMRGQLFADLLGTDFAIMSKRRDYNLVTRSARDSNIKSMNLLGEVCGKTCLLIDDMIDSGGTIITAAECLTNNHHASDVYIVASLPLLSGSALDSFDCARAGGHFTRMIATDAIRHPNLWARDWFIKASVVDFFSDVLGKLIKNESISELLDSKAASLRLLRRHE